MVPKLQDKRAEEETEEALGLTTWAKEKGVAFVAHRGRGMRVGWAIAFHPPRYHVA
jgi:hypothetical protein